MYTTDCMSPALNVLLLAQVLELREQLEALAFGLEPLRDDEDSALLFGSDPPSVAPSPPPSHR